MFIMRTTLSKHIEQIAGLTKHTRSPKTIIDDLMQLSFNFIRTIRREHSLLDHRCMVFNPSYIQPLTPYESQPKAWEKLQEAFTAYLHEVREHEPFSDILGMQYDEYLGQSLGQFLTPPDVANVIADLMPCKGHRIVEPCCGAGALMLPMLRKFHAKNELHLVQAHANDLDPKMCVMAAVQMLMPSVVHNIRFGELEITQGNALTGKLDLVVYAQ